MPSKKHLPTNVATSPASPAGASVPDIVRWLMAVNLHIGLGLGKGLGGEGGVGVGLKGLEWPKAEG